VKNPRHKDRISILEGEFAAISAASRSFIARVLQIVPHDGASRCAAGDLLESRAHKR
jgi:hypothetical protein